MLFADDTVLTGPYTGFSEGWFEMEMKVTKNEFSMQVHQSLWRGVRGPLKGPIS